MDYADYGLPTDEITDIDPATFTFDVPTPGEKYSIRQPVIAVVEDGVTLSNDLWAICEFLDIAVVRVSGDGDLAQTLRRHAPMAIVCALDGIAQDGCHVMKTVACHDATLPILMVTGEDSTLAGAADAVEEIWQMTEVTKAASLPTIAGMVDFLFRAGRKGECMRLMPAHS